MKTIGKLRSFGVLFVSLALAGAGCKDNDVDDPDPDDVTVTTVDRTGTTAGTATGPGTTTTTTTTTVTSRTDYTSEARLRLNQLDHKLSELKGRADAKAAKASVDLQVQRDELARKLDRAADTTEAGWDQFKSDVSKGFDDLEHEIDDALD
jgi:hypothetical protein